MILAVALIILAGLIFSWLTFRAGYNLGWNERHKEMILPRNILKRVNHDIDVRETHHRHSGVWK